MFRRQFLTRSVALALGAAVPKTEAGEVDADLLVIGSGAAGLSAAYWAACAGVRNILVLEKEPLIGGSSTIAEGVFSVSDTAFQRSRNVADSDALFFEDMLRQGNYRNDPRLVRLYIAASKKVFDWFLAQGVRPASLLLSSGMSAPRAHGFNSTALVQTLRLQGQKLGVRIATGTRAVRLLSDGSRVHGAAVVGPGHETGKIHAAGVVLATGGFARNRRMLTRFAPSLKHAAVISGIGSTGDGITMATALGAQLLDTEYIKASYGFRLNPASIGDFTSIYYEGAVIVNQYGRRFVDESSSYKTLGEKALEQPEGKSYIIFDDKMRLSAMAHRPIDRQLWSVYDRGEPADYVYWGESVEAAAKKAGLSPLVVRSTVDEYNRCIESGLPDAFGRTTLSAGYGRPIPLKTAPFFIMPSVPAIMGTYCGLRVNERMQVLGPDERPIAGLFAAGEVTGGLHGENYITGTGLGKALTFGMLAGQSAAAAGSGG